MMTSNIRQSEPSSVGRGEVASPLTSRSTEGGFDVQAVLKAATRRFSDVKGFKVEFIYAPAGIIGLIERPGEPPFIVLHADGTAFRSYQGARSTAKRVIKTFQRDNLWALPRPKAQSSSQK